MGFSENSTGLGSSSANGDPDPCPQQLATDIPSNLLNLVKSGESHLKLEQVSQECLLILGRTKSGKSTLRMLLSHKDTLEQLQAVGSPPLIEDKGAGELGDGTGTSCTAFPTFFKIPETNDLTWVDTPGAGDNRGTEQEIAGMYFLNKVANETKRLKFLIVVQVKAFDRDGDKTEYTFPLAFAHQLIRHVLSRRCLGLVISKVAKSDDDVMNRVVGCLGSITAQDFSRWEDETGRESAMEMVKELVDPKKIFIVRRPPKADNVESQSLKEILWEPGDPESEPYYCQVCRNLIDFCGGLEYAEKRGDFAVKPSADTINNLKLVYEKNAEAMMTSVQNLLEELSNWIENEHKVPDKRTKLLLNLTQALPQIPEYLRAKKRNKGSCSSRLIGNLTATFDATVCSDWLERLKSLESQVSKLTEITNISPPDSSEIAESFWDFQEKLKKMHRELLFGDKNTNVKELSGQVKMGVEWHVKHVMATYQDRFDKLSVNCGDVAAEAVNCHVSLINEALSNKDITSPGDTCRFLYPAFSLVITDSVEQSLRELECNSSNLKELGSTLGNPNESLNAIQSFLEELSHRAPSSEISHEKREQLETLMTNLYQVILKEEVFPNLNIDSLSDKLEFFKSLLFSVKKFRDEVGQEISPICSLLQEIQYFCKILREELPSTLRWVVDDLSCMDLGNHYLLAWRQCVNMFYDNLEQCADRFEYVQQVVAYMLGSFEGQRKWKTLLAENVDKGKTLEDFSKLTLEGLPRFPEDIGNIYTSPEEAEVFHKIFTDTCNSSTVYCDKDENGKETDNKSLLFLGTRDVHLKSDLVDQKGHPAKDKAFSNLFLLAGGTIHLDHHLLELGGKINNLFLSGTKINCVDRPMLVLRGTRGTNAPQGVQHGTTHGESGHDGRDGGDGGHGGNVYMVLQEPLSDASLEVYSRGGDGGVGQGGGDGYCGLDDELYSASICKQLGKHFTIYNTDFETICKKMGLQVPDWNEYELDEKYKENTPNAGLFNAVRRRFDLLLALKFVIDTIHKETCSLEQSCFHSALLDFKGCKEVNELLPLFTKECQTKVEIEETEETVCGVAAFVKQETLGSKILAKYREDKNGHRKDKFWLHGLDQEIANQLVFKGDQTSNLVVELIDRACEELDFLLRLCSAEGEESALKRTGSIGRKGSFRMKAELEKLGLMVPEEPVAQPGGAGGKGGDGGRRGCPGIIKVYPEVPEVEKVVCRRQHGFCGRGGKGGKGAPNGKIKGSPDTVYQDEGDEGTEFVDQCKEECGKNSESWQLEMVDKLKECSKWMDWRERLELIQVFGDNPWGVENVLTTELFLDEYLDLLNLSSSDRDYSGSLKIYQDCLVKYLSSGGDEPDPFLEATLACCYSKRMTWQLTLEHPPVILNLKEYLDVCSKRLKCIEKAELSAASQDYRVKRLQELEVEIQKKKKTLGDAISKYMESIKELIGKLEKKVKMDLEGYIKLIQKKAFYERLGDFLKIAGLVVPPALGEMQQVGKPGRHVAKGVISAVSAVVNKMIPKFTCPQALMASDLFDPERLLQDTQTVVADMIAVLEEVQDADVKGLLSDSLKLLKEVHTELENSKAQEDQFLGSLKKVDAIKTELLDLLGKKRDSSTDNKELQKHIICLIVELTMADFRGADLYLEREKGKLEKGGDAVMTAVGKQEPKEVLDARKRQDAVEKEFSRTLLDHLSLVDNQVKGEAKSQIGKGDWKDLLAKLKEHLGAFVKGLPADKEFQAVIKMFEQAVDLHFSLWSSIGELEDKIQLTSYIANVICPVGHFKSMIKKYEKDKSYYENLKGKVLRIQYLTQVDLLLMEFEKIKGAFLQWIFPYADKYLRAVEKQMQRVNAFFKRNGGSHSEEDIQSAISDCQEIIQTFQKIYEETGLQSTDEDETRVTEQFYKVSGNRPFHEWKVEENGSPIRRLFLGFPTKFVADVVKDSPKGKAAIKVNQTVDLRFKYEGELQVEYQKELDNLLEHFVLEMTHSGKSFYRLGSKCYVIQGKPLKLLGNVGTGGHWERGKMTENDLRLKMKDHVLSPYTEWTFQLQKKDVNQSISFAELADKFAHCVNVELVGCGRYLNERGNYTSPVAVEKHYKKM